MFDAATNEIIPSLRLARLHVFRHGEVQTGTARVCRGQIDVLLSERGMEQSAFAAGRFLERHGRPDRVYSSDLTRCRVFAEQFGAPVRLVRDLREQDMGDWEGKTWEELTQKDPEGVTAYWNNYVAARPRRGESWREVSMRVGEWWQEESPLEGRIVIVTHIGPIRALLCHWLGLGPDQALRFAPTYASETVVLDADAGVVIESMGA